jgi:serine/threonine protein phosphatase PrpC
MLGLRPSQEDRFVLVPRFGEQTAVHLFGVFDGTVGDDASEFVSKRIVHEFCGAEGFSSPDSLLTRGPIAADSTAGGSEVTSLEGPAIESTARSIELGLRQCFLATDRALLSMCHERHLHYASSTGVLCFLWHNLLSVAHVGDSKACIARIVDGAVLVEWLTIDHKPNMPNELRRIEQSGGSLTYLHGNKPFIR